MPGARPESNGPVWAVTAWRASNSRVDRGGAAGAVTGEAGVSIASAVSVIGDQSYRRA
jgi:hypothetical protein